eukprot:contig_25687_g6332
MKVADAADQVSGVPVVGAAIRHALLAAQTGAFLMLAGEHGAIRAGVTDRCKDMLNCVLSRTVEVMQRPQADFTEAHLERLWGLLGRLEAVLGGVEVSFFSSRVKSALLDGEVRGWEAKLDELHAELLVMTEESAFKQEVTDGLNLLRKNLSNVRCDVRAGQTSAPHLELDARFDVRVPDRGYVAGVATPGRVEHTLLAALRDYVVGEGDEAPRLGVCGIGGSGKSTACAGVATSEEVCSLFARGRVWVQLGDVSSPQTLVDAVVALVFRFCGRDLAERLLSVSNRPEGTPTTVVGMAAGYVESVLPAVAAQWLVIIDDMVYTKIDLLQQLLRVVPPGTPVLFTTRSESVVDAVDSQLVTIDELPDLDARMLLAKAMGRRVVVGVPPFSPTEDAAWVRRVLIKTERHALSLSIVGAMIGRRRAWRLVVDTLEERWMAPDFGTPNSCLDLRSSVRATLATSLALLPDAVSRSAFAALGIMPSSVDVGVGVLSRLWRQLLVVSADANVLLADRGGGDDFETVAHRAVAGLVDTLVCAGLLRSVVCAEPGETVAVILHPVVSTYARRLLGVDCGATHGRMLGSYMEAVGSGGFVMDGMRFFDMANATDDGYLFDHVARHARESGDVGVLVSLARPHWGA